MKPGSVVKTENSYFLLVRKGQWRQLKANGLSGSAFTDEDLNDIGESTVVLIADLSSLQDLEDVKALYEEAKKVVQKSLKPVPTKVTQTKNKWKQVKSDTWQLGDVSIQLRFRPAGIPGRPDEKVFEIGHMRKGYWYEIGSSSSLEEAQRIGEENLKPAETPTPASSDSDNRFVVGRTYTCRSVGDSSVIFRFKLVDRKGDMLTLKENDGETHRRKASVYRGEETCYPLGKYSMCPVLRSSEYEKMKPERKVDVRDYPPFVPPSFIPPYTDEELGAELKRAFDQRKGNWREPRKKIEDDYANWDWENSERSRSNTFHMQQKLYGPWGEQVKAQWGNLVDSFSLTPNIAKAMKGNIDYHLCPTWNKGSESLFYHERTIKEYIEQLSEPKVLEILSKEQADAARHWLEAYLAAAHQFEEQAEIWMKKEGRNKIIHTMDAIEGTHSPKVEVGVEYAKGSRLVQTTTDLSPSELSKLLSELERGNGPSLRSLVARSGSDYLRIRVNGDPVAYWSGNRWSTNIQNDPRQSEQALRVIQ